MEAFIGTIAASAVGALFWLAYNHPASIRRISWYILVPIWAFLVGAVVWDTALNAAYQILLPRIEIGKLQGAYGSLSRIRLSGWAYPTIGVGSSLLMWLLTDFVANLKQGGKDEKK